MNEPPIIVRKLGDTFRFDELESAQIRIGHPEESYLVIAGSVWLPALEPYLVRTMRAASEQIDDPELRADMKTFNGQEGQHARQHRRLNKTIETKGFPELARYAEQVQADFMRLSKTRSLKFNVAYAASFEAITTAGAKVVFETDVLEHYQPSVRQLFEWHLLEEVEHRLVAWDVYMTLYGGYWYRIFVMLYMLRHIFSWTFRIARYMLRADPDYPKNYDVPLWRRFWELMKTEGPSIPATLRLFLPWYSPRRLKLPDLERLRAAASHYSELAAN